MYKRPDKLLLDAENILISTLSVNQHGLLTDRSYM